MNSQDEADAGRVLHPEPKEVGWAGSFPEYAEADPQSIFESLRRFVTNPGSLQETAWRDSIPKLQQEVREVLGVDEAAPRYSLLKEYQVPLELRRSDAVMLVRNCVIVLELKAKRFPSAADLDQAAGYARDLRAYHRECEGQLVHAVLVPMQSTAPTVHRDGVWICAPGNLDELVAQVTGDSDGRVVSLEEFLAEDAFRPLPTLVQAARQLFFNGTVTEVWRAKAATEPAVEYISRIAHLAAQTRTRHLVLVTGTPGAGKTLVGMRAVHAHHLDDLAAPRRGTGKSSPALFLSGNQPLVEVLQYVLRGAGGDGKTFVRHIKGYLNTYVPRPDRVPPEHLLVFDEAQRAFSPDKVREIHKDWPDELINSEPSLFIRLCERIPDWCVLVGLIGSGQEIYLGEEGGLAQWRTALESSGVSGAWTVHAPAKVQEVFEGSKIGTSWAPELHLDTQLRFHTATGWHKVVEKLVGAHGIAAGVVREGLDEVYFEGQHAFRIWLTRDLKVAKEYLHERYADAPEARYGLLASSRDKVLSGFEVPNKFPQYSRIRVGKWFADGGGELGSCRHLATCVTEFQSQGLELDMTLLAWGSDFIRENGAWTSRLSRKFAKGGVSARNPHALRANSYRVLLTRGRDGTVIYVPEHKLLDETWAFLRDCGFADLTASNQSIGSAPDALRQP